MINGTVVKNYNYRGWDVKIFLCDDKIYRAQFENEHLIDFLPDESRPLTIDSCCQKVERAINMRDTFDPQFRSASHKDINPPDF